VCHQNRQSAGLYVIRDTYKTTATRAFVTYVSCFVLELYRYVWTHITPHSTDEMFPQIWIGPNVVEVEGRNSAITGPYEKGRGLCEGGCACCAPHL
jgi:hypothetical protein